MKLIRVQTDDDLAVFDNTFNAELLEDGVDLVAPAQDDCVIHLHHRGLAPQNHLAGLHNNSKRALSIDANSRAQSSHIHL